MHGMRAAWDYGKASACDIDADRVAIGLVTLLKPGGGDASLEMAEALAG